MFEGLCKIYALIKNKFSWTRNHSPSPKASSKSHHGNAGATTGDNSPIHFGDNYFHLPPQIDKESSFKNTLTAVAHELPHNFRNRGNFQYPFLTQALEKLVFDEPLVHQESELLKKAMECLNTAKELSTAQPYHPRLKPSDGQALMKELAALIDNQYGIKGPGQI